MIAQLEIRDDAELAELQTALLERSTGPRIDRRGQRLNSALRERVAALRAGLVSLSHVKQRVSSP